MQKLDFFLASLGYLNLSINKPIIFVLSQVSRFKIISIIFYNEKVGECPVYRHKDQIKNFHLPI